MRKDVLQWLIPVLLAVVLAGALWFYWWKSDRPADDIAPDAQTETPAPVDTTPAPGPVHPLPEPVEEVDEQSELRPLPPLEDSDEYFRIELSELFGEGLSEQLAERSLVERVVATIDNLPREQIADRIKPMSGISGQLIVNEGEQEGEYVLAAENYERYDGLVEMLERSDVTEMEELYKRFFPLFQKAYVDLGYPEGYFNDRVIEVIDHLLATPEPEGELVLVRPHVLYEFADPELEALSPGQKLLLRMGEEHRTTIKNKLREFRGGLVAD